MTSNDSTTQAAWTVAGRDALAPLVAHIERVRVPQLIYHYTTPQGFLGIVGSLSIWGTHIRQLNDRGEISYSEGLLNRALSEYEDELTESQREGFGLLRQFLEIYAVRAGRIRGDTYVTAFSEKEDHLSQWERYAGPFGYAIGFGVSETMLQPDGPIFNLTPIEYRQNIQLQVLKEILEIGFGALLNVESGERTIENLRVWANNYANVLNVASHNFKHESFSEEGEWRIATRTRSESYDEVKFRVGRFGIVPYLNLDFSSNAHLIIKKIIVAPTNYFDESKSAVELRLLASGLDPAKIEVVISQVPLRT